MKTKFIKRKFDKLYIIKIENVYASKNANEKTISQDTNWEKITVNHILDKEFVSRIYNEAL